MGLGISSREPFYVVRVDPQENAVYIGTKDEVCKKEIIVNNLNILEPSAFAGPFLRATVKIRSTMMDEPATIYSEKDRGRIIFDSPQWAPAPGQSADFYDNEFVIGGGVIQKILG